MKTFTFSQETRRIHKIYHEVDADTEEASGMLARGDVYKKRYSSKAEEETPTAPRFIAVKDEQASSVEKQHFSTGQESALTT